MTCYAVIDTNVLVSSLLSKKDDSATVQVLGKVIIGEVIPVYSNVITKEYRKVLSRKKFDFSGDTIEYLLSAVEKYGILIDPSPSRIILPDMKDLPFYEALLEKRDVNAYLVTGNIKRNTTVDAHLLHQIKCGYRGSWYGSKVWHSNRKYRKVIWQCNHKFDNDDRYHTPHLYEDNIKASFLSATNRLLSCKDSIIADADEMVAAILDTTALEKEQDELLEETQLISEMVQAAIVENATVALDQTEYQKRYDSLSTKFDKSKARLEQVMADLQQMQLQRAEYESFLKTFKQLPDSLEEFSIDSWNSLVEYATVYSADDIRFTFKNGQEIKA